MIQGLENFLYNADNYMQDLFLKGLRYCQRGLLCFYCNIVEYWYIIICKKRVYIILSLVLNVYENIEINSMLKVYKDMNFF